MPSATWAIVAGGGTAGHVLPAVAVAHALAERGHDTATIHFVGGRRSGLEARLVPQAGFGITLLPGRGIARELALSNIVAVFELGHAFVKAMVLMARRRPSVVLSVGGYASVPCALAAVVLRVPLVVAESNAVAGAANRLVGRFAKAAAVAFEGAGLPRAVVTGNPVRPEVLAVERTDAARREARAVLGVPEGRVVVAATGGSLGARRINEAMLGAGRRWAHRRDLAVHHVVGERDWPWAEPLAGELGGGDGGDCGEGDGLFYAAVRYEERMDALYAACDLLVCRAGGTTVAELCAVGIPAIYVPLPIAPGDHQTANARAVVDAGGGVIVPDHELDGDRLVAEVDRLIDEGRLEAMAVAARSLGVRDAADRVAALLEEHARG